MGIDSDLRWESQKRETSILRTSAWARMSPKQAEMRLFWCACVSCFDCWSFLRAFGPYFASILRLLVTYNPALPPLQPPHSPTTGTGTS